MPCSRQDWSPISCRGGWCADSSGSDRPTDPLWKLVSAILNLVALLLVAVGAVLMLLADRLIDVLGAGFEPWQHTQAVGMVRVMRAALPHLRRSEHASVVNTCSIAATAGLPNRAALLFADGDVSQGVPLLRNLAQGMSSRSGCG